MGAITAVTHEKDGTENTCNNWRMIMIMKAEYPSVKNKITDK